MPTKPKKPEKQLEMSLVGLCFHIFGENKKVQYQGSVRGMVNDSSTIVQYFEWVMGEPNTLELVPVEQMSKGATQNSCSPGSWQFYEDHGHMNDWYERHKAAHYGS